MPCRNPHASFQVLPRASQTLPKPSQNPPKTIPKSSKSDSKSTPKASWSSCWTNVSKRYDFERPKNGQHAPKSVQKTPQSGPNPSQIELKTFPNLFLETIFEPFFAHFKFVLIFDRFWLMFLLNFKSSAFTKQNKNLCFLDVFAKLQCSKVMQKTLNKCAKTLPKPSQNLPKSIKSCKKAFHNATLTEDSGQDALKSS